MPDPIGPRPQSSFGRGTNVSAGAQAKTTASSETSASSITDNSKPDKIGGAVDEFLNPNGSTPLSERTRRRLGAALIRLEHSVSQLKTPAQKLQLWPEQIPAFRSIGDFLERSVGGGNTLAHLVAPPGSGKTALYGCLLEALRPVRGKLDALVLFDGPDALTQALRDFKIYAPNVPVSVFRSGKHDLSAPVVFATYHMLGTLLKDATQAKRQFDLVLPDEVHLGLSDLRYGAIRQLGEGGITIGFTATPEYTRKYGTSHRYGEKIYEKKLVDGIHEGLLAGLRCMAVVTKVDLSDVPSLGGDFDQRQLSDRVNVRERNRAAVALMKQTFPNDQAFAFCVDKRHCADVVKLFNEAGIPAGMVVSGMPRPERKEVYARFEKGDLRVLATVDIVSRSYSNPKVRVGLRMRPTRSPVVLEQQVGRLTRRHGDDVKMIVEFLDRGGALQRKGHALTAPQLIGVAMVLPNIQGGKQHPDAAPSKATAEPAPLPDLPEVRVVSDLQETFDLTLKSQAKAEPVASPKVSKPPAYNLGVLLPPVALRIRGLWFEEQAHKHPSQIGPAISADVLAPVRQFLFEQLRAGRTQTAIGEHTGTELILLPRLLSLCGFPGVARKPDGPSLGALFKHLLQKGASKSTFKTDLSNLTFSNHVAGWGIPTDDRVGGRIEPGDLVWPARELLKACKHYDWWADSLKLEERAQVLLRGEKVATPAMWQTLVTTPELNRILVALARGLVDDERDAEELVLDAQLLIAQPATVADWPASGGLVACWAYLHLLEAHRAFIGEQLKSNVVEVTVGDERLTSLLERSRAIGANENIARESKVRSVQDSLQYLTPRETEALMMRSAKNEPPLKQICDALDVSRERARQILAFGASKLRRGLLKKADVPQAYVQSFLSRTQGVDPERQSILLYKDLAELGIIFESTMQLGSQFLASSKIEFQSSGLTLTDLDRIDVAASQWSVSRGGHGAHFDIREFAEKLDLCSVPLSHIRAALPDSLRYKAENIPQSLLELNELEKGN